MQWHEIVMAHGSPESGELSFQIVYRLPDDCRGEPATLRQIEAIKIFYRRDFGDLSQIQSHALLSCREFARLCSTAMFKRHPDAVRNLIAPCLAAFILADQGMVEFAVNWNDRNFARGTGSPRVRGTPIFADVAAFADFLDGSMELNGWTLEAMKSGSFKGVS